MMWDHRPTGEDACRCYGPPLPRGEASSLSLEKQKTKNKKESTNGGQRYRRPNEAKQNKGAKQKKEAKRPGLFTKYRTPDEQRRHHHRRHYYYYNYTSTYPVLEPVFSFLSYI